MTQISPLLGSVLQTPQAQKQQTDSKTQQVRRAQELLKNAGGTQNPEDTVDIEVPVESLEELKPIQDHGQDSRQKKSPRHPHAQAQTPDDDETEERLDLTA